MMKATIVTDKVYRPRTDYAKGQWEEIVNALHYDDKTGMVVVEVDEVCKDPSFIKYLFRTERMRQVDGADGE